MSSKPFHRADYVLFVESLWLSFFVIQSPILLVTAYAVTLFLADGANSIKMVLQPKSQVHQSKEFEAIICLLLSM